MTFETFLLFTESGRKLTHVPSNDMKLQIYLVDFGIVERYVNAKGQHREQTMEKTIGTPTFISLASHIGSNCSRRDDVESLGNVLLYFMRGGSLPWEQAKNDDECLAIKKQTSLTDLCKGVEGGDCIKKYLEKARALAYDADVDYGTFNSLLDKIGECQGAGGSKPRTSKKKGSADEGGAPKPALRGTAAKQAEKEGGGETVAASQKKGAYTLRHKGDDKVVDLTGPAEGAQTNAAKRSKTVPSRSAPVEEEVIQNVEKSLMLDVVEGPLKGKTFLLPGDKNLQVGSKKGVEVLLDDKSVLPVHCKLEPAKQGRTQSFRVVDKSGDAGTFVNGEKLATKGRQIFAGDVIQLGETKLILKFA